MGFVYTVPGTDAAAAPEEILSVTAAQNSRVFIRGITIGYTTTSTAILGDFEIVRISAEGTGSSVTPEPLDPDAPASRFTALNTFTADGTKGVVIFNIGAYRMQSSYVLWFPGAPIEAVNQGIVALWRADGVSSTVTYITRLYVEEN